ncbi:hypothetical protein TNCV_3591891 [Trichonephila clavipes]|nr:hypothetical protein TNCV_3591891 [Trichonephila clavipes]
MIFSLQEGEFSYRAIATRVQWNSSAVMRVWKHSKDDVGTRRLTSAPHGGIPGAIFQQDNALLHVAITFRDLCSAQHMQLLPLPIYSTDISPIEYMCDLVGRRLARDPRPAASKELLLRLQAIWHSLPQADI